MSDTETRKPARKAENDTKADGLKGDAGEAEIQQRVDQEQAQGFVGTEVDPTPNENYTVGGVIRGLPTPETDEAARAEARRAAGLR